MKDLQLFFIFSILLFHLSCSMLSMEDPPPPAELDPTRILVIVEESILTSLSHELTVYSDDILAEGGSVKIRPFSNENSIEDLKSIIKDNRDTIDGSFLIGDLPSAWYEQTAFGKFEEFPIDIFLMDLDATWSDVDHDGKYDGHSSLKLSKYASRINGTAEQITSYFSRLHDYRMGNYEYLGGAYIFKDDDWFNTFRSSSFGLERMYSNVKINQTSSETQKEDYIHRLSFDGADYVYQWIHASATTLYIKDGSVYSPVRDRDISSNNVRGRFLNMFNCKGARYTQTNLAMTYLTETDTGLALTGSTKVGGNYYPLEFHRTLILGSSWGNAFKSWYNYYGSKDDEWFLGMVILGDPALVIKDSTIDRSLSRSSITGIFPPDDKDVIKMGLKLRDFEKEEQSF